MNLLLAALIASAFAAAASDQPNKTSAQQVPGAGQNPQLYVQTPFKVWPDGNYIFVVNEGTKDWTGPITVTASCVPVAPTTTCGANFPGGKFSQKFDSFPKGHGNAPVKGSGNAQQVSGSGWIAVFMGLPAGSYKITAKAANDASPETPVTIQAQGTGNTIQVKPGVIQLAPTSVPTPSRKP